MHSVWVLMKTTSITVRRRYNRNRDVMTNLWNQIAEIADFDKVQYKRKINILLLTKYTVNDSNIFYFDKV
jgi:hypothetical protein